MGTLIDPVIIIPGITATLLKDEYAIDHETVWGVLGKNFERVALHPNNLKLEALEPARIKPASIFEVAYRELIEELRYNLKDREDEVVPVYPFGYDWRMPLELIENELNQFILEVIERTKLIRHYHEDGYADQPRVNLIGHSMGGLIITGYLNTYKAKAKVNKVVTIATPFQGSFEAVMKISTGMADLGTSPGSSRERETARLTPALYYLLPMFRQGIQIEEGIPDTLFDIQTWQPSVLQSIAEFIRLKGLPVNDREEQAKAIFSGLLGNARKHGENVKRFKLSSAGLDDKKWMAIVGVNAKTRVKLNVIKRDGVTDLDIRSTDRDNLWEKKDPAERRLTGDGTVPFEGAVPPFLKEENLICVTQEDYGYWELQDKTLSSVAGFHGILPNMNLIHRLIVRFLKNQEDQRNNTWGRRAPGVKNWNPPIRLNER